MKLTSWRRLLVAILLVTTTACGNPQNANAEWCGAFEGLAGAAMDLERQTEGTVDWDVAAERLGEALVTFRDADPPEVIAEDFDVWLGGPSPLDRGDAFEEASDRLRLWIVENCGLSPEMTSQLFE